VSEAGPLEGVLAGSGAPITARGRSVAYVPPPWRMRGRTIALWYRLADPEEARRHVPAAVEMDADPVVRARFWDMQHDAVPDGMDGSRPWRPFREAVVAFPVRHGAVTGDYPTYMYADDFAYIVFGREVMGWPVRDGDIHVDAEPPGGPATGVRIGGRLDRAGRTIMTAGVVLTGEQLGVDDSRPPRWLATKVITDVSGPRATVSQLVATGPQRIHGRRVWKAEASLAFDEAPGDELHYLAPREIVEAQYWSDVELTIGWGEVLAELGEQVWATGGHDLGEGAKSRG
jgi:acetoacetate decarboxylase